MMMGPWIILDRDGVINEDSTEYIKSPKEWIPVEKSPEAIALLNEKGYSVAVATNQSGLARGYYDSKTLDQIHQKMHATVESKGGKIIGIALCPHGPTDNCECRKPAPGLLEQLAEKFKITLEDTYFVGDSWRDIETARNAKAKPVLVLTGNGHHTQYLHQDELTDCLVHENLWDFANQLPPYQKLR